MYRVYIDTSKRHINKVVLYLDDKIIDQCEGDIDVVATMESMFRSRDIDPKDVWIDFFAGPGESFTGLKVGATIANVYNFLTGKITLADLKFPNYGREPNISVRKQ